MVKRGRHLFCISMVLFIVLSIQTVSNNMAQASAAEPEPHLITTMAAQSTDNTTGPSDNIRSKDDATIIYFDKSAGKQLRDDSSIITLTPAQKTEMQKVIDEKKKLINNNLIRFPSKHSLNISPGSVAPDIVNSVKANGEKPGGLEKSDNNYYVLQFNDDPATIGEDTRDLLKQAGCIFYDYVPNYAYYVKIPPESVDKVISLVKSGKARYLGHIPPEAKIHSELMAKMQASPDKTFEIAVRLFDKPDSSQLDALGDIMQFNLKYYLVLDNVNGVIKGNRIQDIINLAFVQWIEEGSQARACNNDGTSALGDDIAQYAGSNGDGVNIAIVDSGIAENQYGTQLHDDLTTVVDQYNFLSTGNIARDDFGHGTHLAGIIGGSGIHDGTSRYRGMAPESSLLIYKITNAEGLISSYGLFGGALIRAAQNGANIVNASFQDYGSPGGYNSFSQYADQAVRGEFHNNSGSPQYINVIASAGNGGNNYIGPPGTAKNAITVGAVTDGKRNISAWESQR